jgi:Cu(I)/Ag(I) efflux system membrane fusion protein
MKTLRKTDNIWWTVKVSLNKKTVHTFKKNIDLLWKLLMASILLMASCKTQGHNDGMAGADEYYTCSMDPQVIENKAGNCPICHMKLIKVKKNSLKAGQIKLSAQQIKLAHITYDTLRIHELAKEVTLTGKVTVDQNLSEAISARLKGRITMLAVKNIGNYVSNGQLLYEIYSEELNAAQQEYILATQNAYSKDFEIAAKNKLQLYGMSETQINEIRITRQVLQNVPVYSNTSGYVSELSVTEGNYVSTGTTLFRLSSLNSLWVEAQVYLPYLPYLQMGTEASFSIPAASERSFSGKVIFIDPQVQSPERFVLARFQIADPSNQVKPGMLANITLKTEKKRSLALPVDAIIQDSKGANVWILNKDGVFENKMVMIGMQDSRQVEITDGLKEGDVVVVTGAYLLNSEYVFKRGASPMEGHDNMPGMKM